jgi:2-iminobutanoate/2-iminopropanoate deaminase
VAPYSPVVRSGDHAYTAGQVGFDASGTLVPGGVAEQTRQTLANLEACLAAAGCTLDDVVKVNAFLVDLGDFDAFNDVYRATFTEPYPARTTVQAGLPAGIRVEIEAVARLPREA